MPVIHTPHKTERVAAVNPVYYVEIVKSYPFRICALQPEYAT
jgi:hypothetical protein